MKKLLALAFFPALTLSASAALHVVIVTVKPTDNVIEYEIVDDHGTPSTADDTIVRHGDQVSVDLSGDFTQAQLQAAAEADATAKGLLGS